MEQILRTTALASSYYLMQMTQKGTPSVAGRLGSFLWFTPFRKKPHKFFQELAASSEVKVIRYKSREIKFRTWGKGKLDQQVVLVHGWGGRWDQFSPMIKSLVAEGCTVSAFDFPAHGETRGWNTDLLEWFDILLEIEKQMSLQNVSYICHSFGFMAVAQAILKYNLKAKNLIALNSPSNFYFLVEQFIGKVKMKRHVEPYLIRSIQKRVGHGIEERVNVSVRRLAERLPFYFIADVDDREVPITEHKEVELALKDKFYRTSGLGHNGILKSAEVTQRIIKLIG